MIQKLCFYYLNEKKQCCTISLMTGNDHGSKRLLIQASQPKPTVTYVWLFDMVKPGHKVDTLVM